MKEPKTKPELLRIWLRSRSHRAADIKKALAYYNERVANNDDPTDAEVEEVAEQAHREDCDAAVSKPVVVEKTVRNEVHETIVHKIAMKYAFYGSFLGAFTALGAVASVSWWVYSMGVR